jgi:hypothetical protein
MGSNCASPIDDWGTGSSEARHRDRQCDIVSDELSAIAKKESSVESFGSRLRVGIAVHPSDVMCFAIHGKFRKKALLDPMTKYSSVVNIPMLSVGCSWNSSLFEIVVSKKIAAACSVRVCYRLDIAEFGFDNQD